MITRRNNILTRLRRRAFSSMRNDSASNHSFPKKISIEEIESIDGTNQSLLAETLRGFHREHKPVVLRNIVSHFPALSMWDDHSYLLKRIGAQSLCEVETVPYNLGERITIPFEQYVDYLAVAQEQCDLNVVIPQEHLLYMAQNDIPKELLSDIKIPSFCSDERFAVGHGKLYSTMLWMGPAGCSSPLHFDPLDNLFMQIVGRKKVFLINENVDSTMFYSGSDFGQQSNTSAISDIETPDLSKYPKFREVPEIQSALLHPGDVLFIPSKWWHALNSLDFSISVNVWWR